MSEISRPWPGVLLGDHGRYTGEEWGKLIRSLHVDSCLDKSRGPLLGAMNELCVEPTVPASMNVVVDVGSALCHNQWYLNDAPIVVPISLNPSDYTRYDRIILRKRWDEQTVRVALLTGTPAGGYPYLTHSLVTQWEIPLALIEVGSGAITIIAADITDEREAVHERSKLLDIGDFETDLAVGVATISSIPGVSLRGWKIDPTEALWGSWVVPRSWGETPLELSGCAWGYNTEEESQVRWYASEFADGAAAAGPTWIGNVYQGPVGIGRELVQPRFVTTVLPGNSLSFEWYIPAGEFTWYFLALELYFRRV